jgi:hypothetical protein
MFLISGGSANRGKANRTPLMLLAAFLKYSPFPKDLETTIHVLLIRVLGVIVMIVTNRIPVR